jgi:hypothetical protein
MSHLVAESQGMIKKLKSPKISMPQKRHLMHNVFGDYRKFMREEEKKGEAGLKQKGNSPSASSSTPSADSPSPSATPAPPSAPAPDMPTLKIQDTPAGTSTSAPETQKTSA